MNTNNIKVYTKSHFYDTEESLLNDYWVPPDEENNNSYIEVLAQSLWLKMQYISKERFEALEFLKRNQGFNWITDDNIFEELSHLYRDAEYFDKPNIRFETNEWKHLSEKYYKIEIRVEKDKVLHYENCECWWWWDREILKDFSLNNEIIID